MWKSTPFRDGVRLREILSMHEDDRFLGWVNLGRCDTPARGRVAGPVGDVVRVLQRDGSSTTYVRPASSDDSRAAATQ
jgi:hypothetical protein